MSNVKILCQGSTNLDDFPLQSGLFQAPDVRSGVSTVRSRRRDPTEKGSKLRQQQTQDQSDHHLKAGHLRNRSGHSDNTIFLSNFYFDSH